jgi:hypothetical protein
MPKVLSERVTEILGMDDEMNRFQKDFLDSVQEMKAERALRAAKVMQLADEVGFDADVSLLTTHHQSVLLKLKSSNTLTGCKGTKRG